MSERIVHQADALEWLTRRGVLSGCSLITSMPDFSEFPHRSLEKGREWFISAAARVLASTPDHGVAIFYQRDSKREGAWIDKSFLLQKAAEASGHALLWHKIVCRVPPGYVAFGMPAYSHLICFSRGIRLEVANSTADVLAQAGDTSWTRGMGVKACLLACQFVLEHTETRRVVDPFCGHGSLLAVANSLGLDAEGIELSRKRADKAQRIFIDQHGRFGFTFARKRPSAGALDAPKL